MKKKIGVIFMQYPKDFINSKTKTRETFYTGQTEEGHKIYAYENMSKNGGKYLSVYFDPESEKDDKYPKSGFVGTQGDDTVIDPDSLPF